MNSIVSKMLDLPERSVWTLINDNKIRSVKCGSRVIIPFSRFGILLMGKFNVNFWLFAVDIFWNFVRIMESCGRRCVC